VTAETREALARLAAALAGAGCRIERSGPLGFDWEAAWETWGEVFGAEVGAPMPLPVRLLFQLRFSRLPGNSPIDRGVVRGAASSIRDYVTALSQRDALIAAIERFLGGVDAWLCPVAGVPAIAHQPAGALVEIDGKKTPYHMALGGYTTPFNLTGHPVVVIPAGQSREGLPIGVQVVARRWKDMELLEVAEMVSAVTGGFQRPPGY